MRLTSRIAATGAGLAVATVTLLTGAPPVQAAATTDPILAAAGWLSTQFVDDSHLPAPDGDHFDEQFGTTFFPNYGENADVIFGLAAAKAGGEKIQRALGYLAKNADAYADFTNSDGFGGPFDGAIGKLAVAAIVAGADPTDFAGHDLMAALAKDECPAAATSCTPGEAAGIFSSISESFVILAEARFGGASAPTATALDYFTSLQCSDGGFTSGVTACGSGAADVDATSYAIMALTAAGGHASERAKAVQWLKGQQQPAGFWKSQGVANVNSTGLAAAALRGTGASVNQARTWLRSQQIPAGRPGAGGFKFAGTFTPTTTSATSPSVLATAQALTGLVDGGGLATLTAAGATRQAALFAPTARLSARTVKAGQKLTADAVGFAAGERVRVKIHSAAVSVGTVTADPSGRVTLTFRIPAGLAGGSHAVTLTGLDSGLTVSRTITIPSAAPSSTPATPPASTPPTGPSAPPVANTGQDRRQLFGIGIAGAAAVAVGAGLLVAGRRRVH